MLKCLVSESGTAHVLLEPDVFGFMSTSSSSSSAGASSPFEACEDQAGTENEMDTLVAPPPVVVVVVVVVELELVPPLACCALDEFGEGACSEGSCFMSEASRSISSVDIEEVARAGWIKNLRIRARFRLKTKLIIL